MLAPLASATWSLDIPCSIFCGSAPVRRGRLVLVWSGMERADASQLTWTSTDKERESVAEPIYDHWRKNHPKVERYNTTWAINIVSVLHSDRLLKSTLRTLNASLVRMGPEASLAPMGPSSLYSTMVRCQASASREVSPVQRSERTCRVNDPGSPRPHKWPSVDPIVPGVTGPRGIGVPTPLNPEPVFAMMVGLPATKFQRRELGRCPQVWDCRVVWTRWQAASA